MKFPVVSNIIQRLEPEEETQIQALLKSWSKSCSLAKAIEMDTNQCCLELWDVGVDIIDELYIAKLSFHEFLSQICIEDVGHQREEKTKKIFWLEKLEDETINQFVVVPRKC